MLSEEEEYILAIQNYEQLKQRTGIPNQVLQKLNLLYECINQEEGREINLLPYSEIDVDDCREIIKLPKSSCKHMFLRFLEDYQKRSNSIIQLENLQSEIDIRTETLKLWKKKKIMINSSQRTFEVLRNSKKKEKAKKKDRIIYLQYYQCERMKFSDKRHRFGFKQLEKNRGYYKELVCGTTDVQLFNKIFSLINQLCKTQSDYDPMRLSIATTKDTSPKKSSINVQIQNRQQQQQSLQEQQQQQESSRPSINNTDNNDNDYEYSAPIQLSTRTEEKSTIKINDQNKKQDQIQNQNQSIINQQKPNQPQEIAVDTIGKLIPSQQNTTVQTNEDDEGEFQDAEEFEEKHPDVIKQNNYPSVFNSILEEGKLHPNYLSTLQDQFTQIIMKEDYQILRSSINPLRFRCLITLDGYSIDRVYQTLAEIDFMKKWNGAINQQESRYIGLIHSQNSAVIYERRNQYGYFYLPRDYIYLRHSFEIDGTYFIIDKSIEHDECPSYIKIIRGEINYSITRINKIENKIEVCIETEITNGGFSSTDQDGQITIVYLQEIANVKKFLKTYISQEIIKSPLLTSLQLSFLQKQTYIQNQLAPEESQQLEIQQDQKQEYEEAKLIDSLKIENQLSVIPDSTTFKQVETIPDQKSENDDTKTDYEGQPSLEENVPSEIVISNNQISEEYKERIKKQIVKVEKETYQNLCLNQKYQLEPSESTLEEYIKSSDIYHYFLKDDWLRDKKEGGLLFINTKKIEAQKQIISYMLKKIGSNLLTGKSVLSITLPVYIFETRSNLERFAYAFTNAPIYLERGAQMKTPEEQMKMTIAFGLSSIVMYLSLEKPFNPILGETYQGFIDGCPVFVEQISHHPPICAFQLYGRGYILDGHIETVANMNANSVVGKNVGHIRVTYKNTESVQIYLLVPGVFQGTTFGKRVFNLSGKGYCLDFANKLVWDASFNPEKSSMFSKNENPIDYFTGGIYRVKPQAIQKYFKEGYAKYSGLDLQKEITEKICDTKGIWNQYLEVNGERLWDINKIPFALKNNPNPLPSDSNYRLDILYWKLNDFDNASKNKELYEIIQRSDKKLREKKTGKKH